MSICTKAHSSLTNHVTAMHDLAGEFKYAHKHAGSLNSVDAAFCLQHFPWQQGSHLTFCCYSNHRLTAHYKAKTKLRGDTDRERWGEAATKGREEINKNKWFQYAASGGKVKGACLYTINKSTNPVCLFSKNNSWQTSVVTCHTKCVAIILNVLR